MIAITPLYVSPKGGSIVCLRANTGRLFRVCSSERCIYSSNLHSAKAQLDHLEFQPMLKPLKVVRPAAQRKTTLKWNSDGELSAVDMARVLDRLTNPELTECDLACNLGDRSPEQRNTIPLLAVPSSAWLP